MVLLEHHKVSRFCKFPFGRRLVAASSTAPLHSFRSKILAFAAELQVKPRITDLKKCFDMIRYVNRAFSEMVVEIDYPINQWGSLAVEEYFDYTLNLLDMLNLINAAVLRLRHSRISILHTLKSITGYHPQEPVYKILTRISGKTIIESKSPNSEKEAMVVHGLAISGDVGVLSLGLALSYLCSDWRIYLETRESIVSRCGNDDSVVKGLDLRFSETGDGIMEEVNEVNTAVEGMAVSNVEKLEIGLRAMEDGIEGIEKEADSLFSESFAARNKLLDLYRDELSKKL